MTPLDLLTLTAAQRAELANGAFSLQGSKRGLRVIRGNRLYYEIASQDEESAKTLCRMMLGAYQVTVLAVWDMLYASQRRQLDNVDWKLTPIRTGELYRVPQVVQQRVMLLEQRDIHFDAYIWGEEQAVPEPRRQRDPILIGVLRVAPHRGVWCLLGVWDH